MTYCKNIAIMPGRKDNIGPETSRIINWLEERNISVMIPEGQNSTIQRPELEKNNEDIKKHADLMISLGGDGTFLTAAGIIAGTDIPILGINLGHLGFLTEINMDAWEPALSRTITGDFEIDERMMVACEVIRNGKSIYDCVGLNEVAITFSREMLLLKLDINISNNYAGTYSADGVIIATPTGSTAYSLSAGGPIINPKTECFVLTAICPHTLTARPLVIPPGEVIEIQERTGRGCTVTLDGHDNFKLVANDRIIIKKYSHYMKFVHLGKKFYTTLREKLKWFE